MRDTPSRASDQLCLIWKESIQNRADTACGSHGRRERQMDGVKPTYPPHHPPTTSFCGDYNDKMVELSMSDNLKEHYCAMVMNR